MQAGRSGCLCRKKIPKSVFHSHFSLKKGRRIILFLSGSCLEYIQAPLWPMPLASGYHKLGIYCCLDGTGGCICIWGGNYHTQTQANSCKIHLPALCLCLVASDILQQRQCSDDDFFLNVTRSTTLSLPVCPSHATATCLPGGTNTALACRSWLCLRHCRTLTRRASLLFVPEIICHREQADE